MSDQLPESFRWSYAICKMVPTAYQIETNYGSLPLDDELRLAVERAVRPILERRLKQAEAKEVRS
ncbi:hypothetical protein [Allochromatium vinosum]|uniref:hypothetical protein n=1 Tax=Allochromatium vinosum TaxID=1049 RepID=UPI001902F688|nr:hypothetical protein [Allochromatium vinosum]